MSKNCIRCVKNDPTGVDLLCDECRAAQTPYFKVEHTGCSFELERAEQAYPRTCRDCGLGPCKYHRRDSAYAAMGSGLFPPVHPDEAKP